VEELNYTIGFLELNSIARGIEAADIMLKAAEVELVLACPTCPGKYTILITGDVAAVIASVDAGEAVGGVNVVERLVIPRVHPQVIAAINHSTMPDGKNAVGVVECFSITSSIIAADSGVKAAEVTLIDVRLGTGIGGKSFVIYTGDVAAVKEAVAAGARSASENGLLLATSIIPQPRQEIFDKLL
jgi:microcompartment protein CcmL/EutN